MTIDFDDLASRALQPQALAAPPSTDFDGLAGQVIDMQRARDRAVATQNVLAAQGTNADTEAKALAASRALGIPQPAAMADPQQATGAAQSQSNVAELAQAPGLASFVADNPLAARLAQDDFSKLGLLDRLTTALKTGAASGLDTNALGRAGNVKQLAAVAGKATPQTDQLIDTLEGRIAATPKLTGALGTVQNFAGFLAGLVDNAAQGGSEGAIAGTAAGALAGSGAAGVGALPGAAAGFLTGTAFGFTADMARVAAGNAYLQLGQLRGSDGQPISEAGRQFGSVFTGAATFALGKYATAIESKAIGSSAEKLAQDAIAQAVQTPTFTRAAAQFAQSTARGAVQGAGVMTAMEASSVIGEEIAKSMSAGHFDTDPQEIVQRLANAAVNGALTLGALHAGAAGLGLYGDFRAASRAQAQTAAFQSLLDGSADSKLRQRDMESFRQFMQAQTDGSPVENLYIPAAAVRELYQGARIDPSTITPQSDPFFGFVPDMAKQLAESADSGGDVVIPTADFVSHLAGSDVATKLMPDIRVGADAMSVNEAKAFTEEYTARVKAATDEAAKASAEPDSGQQIAQAVREQAVAAGRPDAEASRIGAIYAARYTARAARRGLGEDPLALYQAEGPKIVADAAASGGVWELSQGERDVHATITGEEFGKSDLPVDDLRATARQWYRENLQGTSVTNAASGREITFAKSKKAFATSAEPDKVRLFAALPELLKNGQITESKAPADLAKESNVKAYHWLEGTVRVGDRDLRVGVTLREDDKGNLYYNHTPLKREGFATPENRATPTPKAGGVSKEEGTLEQTVAPGEDGLNLHVLDQAGDAPRGKVVFGRDAGATIQLFAQADASTLIHESGHAWLEELLADGNRPDAPAQLREDLDTVTKWLGSDDGKITDPQHEQFARAVEAYFMEGKAPSTALARVFSRFKQWLTKIYRTVSALDTPINSDIRQVFDRLLATDDELAEATKDVGLQPNFSDRAQAGMTGAEWAAYLRTIDKANSQAESTMLGKMMARVRAQRSAEYREERAGVVDDVAKEVDARPDMRALNLLRHGKLDGQDVGERMRLSTETVRSVYGKDGLAALPKGVTAKDGFEPDYVSEMLGFDSPDEMIRALQSLEGQQRELRAKEGDKHSIRQYLIDTEADRRMAERKGELEDEGAIRDEAVAALHSEGREEQLAVELRYLRRSAARELTERGKVRKAGEEKTAAAEQALADEKMGQRWDAAEESARQAALRESVNVTRPMLEAIRAHAEQVLAGKSIEQVRRYTVYLRNERKAAAEVTRAVLAKDWAMAAAAKQRQILWHVLYSKARNAAEDVERGEATFKRLTSKKTFKGLAQDYTDQIHDLLGRFGYDSGRGEELQRTRGATLDQFVRGKFDEDGIELAVDPSLFDAAGKAVKDLTLAEFRLLHEAVDSMNALGRGEKLIEVDGVKRELDEVVGEVVDQVRSLGERMRSDFYDARDAGAAAAFKDKLFGLTRGIDASLTKPEALFDQIDRGDAAGIMNRAVFRRLKDAQGREFRWQTDAAQKIQAAVKAAGKGWRARLRQLVPDDPALRNPDTGRPMKLTRERMVSIALNWGNEGQRTKLAEGYGWDARAVKTFLDRNMTKADWDFAQRVWEIFESNRDELDALQKRVTGLGLDLVQADAFETPHGSYRGGYFPIVYDAARNYAAEGHAEKATADAMFPANYTRATTAKGHTVSRVEGVKQAIELSLDVVPWKIGQVLHDLAFREAIRDSDRILSHPRVKKALDDVFGSEYRKTLRPWLKHVANSRNIDDRAIGWVDHMLSSARTAVVMVGIGFRATTMMKHGMSALSNSAKELGPKWLTAGTREFYAPGHMKDNWAFITGKSAEMASRLHAYDKDTRAAFEHLVSDSRYTAFQKGAQRFGHLGVSLLDMGSAAPTWLGAYRKALSEGHADADAVYLADKTVRNAHGAQGITDLAKFQYAGGVANLFNMFYGFFNHIYNRQRTMFIQGAAGAKAARAGEWKQATKNFADVLATSFWYVAIPALVEAVVTSGGPGEDEGWGEWAAKAILAEIPAGVPVLRDIAKSAIEGRDYEMSPIAKAVNTVVQAGRGAAKLAQGEEMPESFPKHVAEAAGYLTALPTAAPFAAGKFLWDYSNGEADPESLADWYRGLTTGKAHP